MISDNFPGMGQHEMTGSTTVAKASSSKDDKLYDLSMLYEMDGNKYVAKIVAIFLRDTSKELKEMKEAAAAGKINAVYNIAHKLKSSAGIIQANRLSALLEQIESISREGNFEPDLTVKIESTLLEYNQIKPPLEILLKSLA